MQPSELADVLELLARALRSLPSLVTDEKRSLAPAEVTISDWIATYKRLLGERGYKAQTLKNRCANIAHVERLWGKHGIKSLKPHEVSLALTEFLPDKSSTANRVLAELREIYREAIANDWADHNPATSVKLPAHKVQRARLKEDTWFAMRVFARTGPQRWLESLLLLALATGQRRADLAKMQFSDIVDGHLRVEQQKQAGKGYGARVAIPLSLRLDAINMTVGDVIEHCKNSANAGPTLLRKSGGGALEESSLSARFHECICSVLGPDAYHEHEWPSLHEVRSLSARMYLNQGLTMKQVQTLLGHKHEEMTALYIDDRGLSAGDWKPVDLKKGK